MKVKDILKLLKDHNPEATMIFKFDAGRSDFAISSKHNCTHCEKEVYLTIGIKEEL